MAEEIIVKVGESGHIDRLDNALTAIADPCPSCGDYVFPQGSPCPDCADAATYEIPDNSVGLKPGEYTLREILALKDKPQSNPHLAVQRNELIEALMEP